MELLAECYSVARRLPAYELYGLTSQVRRAALSIPTNVAEGCGRSSPKDRLRFFSFARGSVCELQTLLAATELLGYAGPDELAKARDLLGHVGRLLGGLRRHTAVTSH